MATLHEINESCRLTFTKSSSKPLGQNDTLVPLRSRREVLNTTLTPPSAEESDLITFKITEIFGERRDLGQIKIRVLDKQGNQMDIGVKQPNLQQTPEESKPDCKLLEKIFYNSASQIKSRALWIVNFENDKSRNYTINLPKGGLSRLGSIYLKDMNLRSGCKYIKQFKCSVGGRQVFVNEGR